MVCGFHHGKIRYKTNQYNDMRNPPFPFYIFISLALHLIYLYLNVCYLSLLLNFFEPLSLMGKQISFFSKFIVYLKIRFYYLMYEI